MTTNQEQLFWEIIEKDFDTDGFIDRHTFIYAKGAEILEFFKRILEETYNNHREEIKKITQLEQQHKTLKDTIEALKKENNELAKRSFLSDIEAFTFK